MGLVSLFASRIRKVVFSDGALLYAPAVSTKQMHSVFEGVFPDFIKFPTSLPQLGNKEVIEGVLRHAVRTLLGKATISPGMREFLDNNVQKRDARELREYQAKVEEQAGWFRKSRTPKPKAKRTLQPKPRAQRMAFECIIYYVRLKNFFLFPLISTFFQKLSQMRQKIF